MSTQWKNRSARVQVRESELPSSVPPQTGLAFNIWYNKWSQGQAGSSRFVNPFILNVEKDSGRTKADKEGSLYFCLYFSKGMCCLGSKCHYLHHIPEAEDHARLSLHSNALDCFGREKHADYREDMGGIGSFKKPNRILYIGGITGSLNNKTLSPSQVENRIKYTFSRLGELESVRYVENKNCGFVKYRFQCNAEFAKEAMSNQTLLIPSDKEWDQRKEGTGLLVKWANADPNPAARKKEQDEQEKETMIAINNLLLTNEKSRKPDSNELEPFEGNSSAQNRASKHTTIIDSSLLEKLKRRKISGIHEEFFKDSIRSSTTRPLVTCYSSDDD